jgi:hypothetical protein
MMGLFAAWYFFGRFFTPIFLFALRALYPGFHYGPHYG